MPGGADWSATDWETLQFAPSWVTHMVMAATVGKADRNAVMAETDALLDYAASGQGLAQQVCMSIIEAFQETMGTGQVQPELMQRFTADSRGPVRGLMEVRELLEQKASPEDARTFKQTMVLIAEKVLEALGEGPRFHRKKMRSDKMAAMDMVAKTLGVQNAVGIR
jgi:hypothetical protein